MTERVYVHVGPFKTGTTYVQSLLAVNVERLAAQGVAYPGRVFGRQSDAIRDALGQKTKPATSRNIQGEWAGIAAEIADWDGTSAVLSQETLSAASPRDITRLLRRLKGYDVHVVYTARDLSRVAPAMWQTALRNKGTATWAEYIAAVRAPDARGSSGGRHFWRCQDAPALLERWRAHLPLEQLHLVTVPRPGSPRELLWQRFCQVVGVDDISGHDLQPRRSNPSLGTAEAELLRRVNILLETSDIDAKGWLFWMRWLGRQLEERPGATRFSLPPEDFAWISERATTMVAALRQAGYPVVGDLDELVPQPGADPGRHPSDAAEGEILDAALDAVARALRQLTAERRRAERTG